MTALILRGDARALPLPDESVDLVVTSPPYWALRAYEDGGEHYKGQIGSEPTPAEYLDNLWAVARECTRVLKPTGSMFWNLGDKFNTEKCLIGLPWRFAIGCVDRLGLILRRDIVWRKLSPLPESTRDRCPTVHEYLFHLTREPRYFSATDEIREPHAEPGGRPAYGRTRPPHAPGGNRAANVGALPDAAFRDMGQNPLGKIPGSVWDIASEPLVVPPGLGVEHYAAFPVELPRRCILGWSPAGARVLDPFGGTGTTPLVADVLGRDGIGVDASHDYCRLARWRVQDPAQRARAMRVPKPPPQSDGQLGLFEGT